MPVIVVPYDSRLQLNLVTGIDPDTSNPIIRRTSFNNVKSDAEDQDVYDVAVQLASLQKYTLDGVERTNSMQLTS
jgi:hypothetical protein